MRSFILILATVGIIAAGFGVYWIFQPAAPTVQTRAITPVTRPSETMSTQQSSIIGPSEGVWVKQFDPRSGYLRHQFRGAHFNPTEEGTVIVTHPEAEFFLSDGQYLRLSGDSGVVVMDLPDASRQQDQMRALGERPPRRGELQKVTVELFRNPQARRAALTLELPNAEFDNEMFRISTRAYEQDGQTVAADQVPVRVRGADYDFDGRGLVIRWNERDQRLELLEIAHGEKLVIKHPDEFGGGSRMSARAAGAMLADVSGAAVAEELADTGELYQATFSNQVRIEQAGQPLAHAEFLHVSFRLAEADQPASAPSAPDARARDSDEKPATRPRVAPATQPSEPITILWTGPLRIEPRDDRPERRIRAGDALVQLLGRDSPVVVSQQGQRIECATIFYETGDAIFHAESSPAQRVRLTSADGATIDTQTMSFSMARRVATLSGQSRAELPMETDGRREMLVAEWSESCRLTMSQTQQISAADLTGVVVVRHPQLDLNSSTLELRFDETAGDRAGFNVRRIEAAGQVDCRMKDSSDVGEQRIRCDRLTLATQIDSAGRLHPSQIDAAGSVHASDARREIRAGQLSLALAPASHDDPIHLTRFSAGQDVRISTSDGASAQADQIVADERQIKLIGQPARVADASTALTGPIIQIDTDEQKSSVLGRGSLRLARGNTPSGGASTTQPIDLTWSQSAVLDGKSNTIDLSGHIIIQTTDAEAGEITATADRMKLAMIDRPSAHRRIDDDTQPVAWNLNFLQNKEISDVELLDDVKVASELISSGGQLQRRMTLYAPTILYTMADGNLKIPAAGRMLYEDYIPRQAPQDAGQRAPAGATAFAWSEQMRYDNASRQATMSGQVAIVHQPLSGDQRFRLDARRVVAELEPDEARSDEQASFNIQRLIASGDLLFTGRDMELTAETIEYDPNTHWLIGRGNEQSPAVIMQKMNSFSADELQINTQTGDIRFTGAAGTIR